MDTKMGRTGRVADQSMTKHHTSEECIMSNRIRLTVASAALFLGSAAMGFAAQVPYGATQPDIPISSRDRVYHADQTSNTVSVYDPSTNRLLGVILLGDVTPRNLSPLY